MSDEPPNPVTTGDETNDGIDAAEGGTDRSAGRTMCPDGGSRLSDYLEALAHPRRRQVLYYLSDHEHSEFEDVIEQVTSRELRATAGADDEALRAVRIDLHHAQLPKLEASGIISYDRRNGSLRYHQPAQLEELLDCCRSVELPEAEE